MRTPAKTKRPIIFGEVLFDAFPDGSKILGGAPFNVAWHLKGFGLDPFFISAIGRDSNGDMVEQSMIHWGMDTSGLQRDPDHQTGEVQITLMDGQPSFEILPNQAYDFIAEQKVRHDLSQITPTLLYYGSLIGRSEVSKQTLAALREESLPSYVDINLRKPWFTQQSVRDAVAGARWLKLNDEELALLSNKQDLKEAAEELLTEFDLEWIIVTKGADGAFIVSEEKFFECRPVRVENLVDTVGAGDAFSAVTITGIINDWPIETILQRAVEFAAMICGQRGATVANSSFYKNVLERWLEE